jgi:hypothetical protein
MIGISLTAEQVRAAPPEVRHWFEQQVASLFSSAGEPPPEQRHLASLTPGDAQALLEQIEDILPVVSVFFELGREAASVPVQGMRMFRLADILRHTGLQSVAQVIECLDVINDALRNVRHEAEAMACRVDREGHCFVAETTSHSILTVWQGIVAARGLLGSGKPPGAPVMPAELSD